jgi:tellurite resistance protein TerC
MNGTVRLIRRVTIAIIGGTVALIGVVMIVTPGPAIVVLPAGLAILAIEFEFARRWLRAVKERAQSMANHGPSAGRD